MNEQPKNELEMVVDGAIADMIFNVPGTEGKDTVTERLLIRKISIRDMSALGKAWGKPAMEVAEYLRISPERVALLTDESFMTAMSEGRRLNLPFFAKWWEWQAQTLAAMGKGSDTTKMIEQITREMAEKLLLAKPSTS